MPTVSAVIPAYNSAKFVRDAIESVLAQQGVEVEVIVVDDGSTDDTWKVLESFGPAIRCVRQANGGPARARNHAARLATGDWLAFLDADDQWLPGKLQQQLALADDATHLIYTDCYNFGEVDRVQPRQSDSVPLYDGDVFELLLQDNFITLSTVVIRKAWFERLGGFSEDLFLAEDWHLWLRYAAQGRVGLCREPLTRYRWHAGGISKDPIAMGKARLDVLQRALALPRGQQVPRRVANRAFAKAWECSAWFSAPRHPRAAVWGYVRSLWHDPWNPAAFKGAVKCLFGRAS